MLPGVRPELLPAFALPMCIGLFLQGSDAVVGPDPDPRHDLSHAEVSYSGEVVPILEQRCLQCHGGLDENGEQRVELGLNMTTYEGLMAGSEYGSVIEPGDPEGSLLLEMIVEGDMPEEGDPVPPEEIEVIRAWIQEGAANN